MKFIHLLFLTLTSAFVNAQSFVGPESDIESILSNIENFSRWFVEGDTESIVASYTENGKIMPTGSDIMSGQDALTKYWTRSPKVKALHHKLTPVEIIVSGDRATDYGYYEGITQYQDNEPSHWKGKYVIIWKKIKGNWKIDVDIWNRIDQKKEPTIENKMQTIVDSLFSITPDAIGTMIHVEAPDHNISWTAAVGISDKGSGSRLNSNQPVLTASNTKTYVAAAILRLAELNKIKIDQPIINLLSEDTKIRFQNAGYDLKAITLKHLLSHTSGITDYVDSDYFQFVKDNPKHRWTRVEQIERATTNKVALALPGEKFKYADINFVLLTEIIEEITSQPFYQSIRELLKYREYDLNRTWFYTLEPKSIDTPTLAHQYATKHNLHSYDLDPSWDLYGGGGIASTVKDLASFFQYLFSAQIIKDKNLLAQMTEYVLPVEESNYCLGLRKLDFHGNTAYYHGGYWGTDAMYLPELNLSIAAITLQKEGRNINAEISKNIIKLLNVSNK